MTWTNGKKTMLILDVPLYLQLKCCDQETQLSSCMYGGRNESLKAVKIIEGLKAQGYSFKTLSELLAIKE